MQMLNGSPTPERSPIRAFGKEEKGPIWPKLSGHFAQHRTLGIARARRRMHKAAAQPIEQDVDGGVKLQGIFQDNVEATTIASQEEMNQDKWISWSTVASQDQYRGDLVEGLVRGRVGHVGLKPETQTCGSEDPTECGRQEVVVGRQPFLIDVRTENTPHHTMNAKPTGGNQYA
jgi:hypothetical protein